jgi:molybdate transport system regulatory protein
MLRTSSPTRSRGQRGGDFFINANSLGDVGARISHRGVVVEDKTHGKHGCVTRLTLRIDFDENRQLGHGKIRLLELVREHGSISAASRSMEMSYKRAWTLIEGLNGMFDKPLIVTRIGGTGGGKAELTALGELVVETYRAIEHQSLSASSAALQAIESHLARSPGP